MKTNKLFLDLVIAFFLLVCTAERTLAQQPHSNPVVHPAQTANNSMPAKYTYKIFQAPNKRYGYDIFLNGKGIFHQVADATPNAAVVLAKKEQAEKAAVLAIEKIKQGTTPELNNDELKKIVAE